MSSDLQTFFLQIPPITRTMLGSSLILFLITAIRLVSPYYLFNVWSLTIFKAQIWRPFTAFMFPPAMPMEAIMDIYALYNYSKDIETNKFQKDKARYAWYLTFISVVIMFSNYFLGGVSYFKPLVVALTYTWAQDNTETQVMFYVVKVKAVYMPFIMLLFAFIVGGQASFLASGSGYLSAHLFLFFDTLYPMTSEGKHLWFIRTPALYHQLCAAYDERVNKGKPYNPAAKYERQEGFGTVIRPANPGGSNYTKGSATTTALKNPFSFSSPFKGKGKRLGG